MGTALKQKIALFTNVAPDAVFSAEDVDCIYEVPAKFHKQGVDEKIAELLNIWSRAPELTGWEQVVERVRSPQSEVEIALAAADTLAARNVTVRLVALPSWELFELQDAEYREAVLPAAVTARVSIEAASTFGWSRYVGSAGASVGIDHFGASAPAKVLYKEFGITAENLVATALRVLGRS